MNESTTDGTPSPRQRLFALRQQQFARVHQTYMVVLAAKKVKREADERLRKSNELIAQEWLKNSHPHKYIWT